MGTGSFPGVKSGRGVTLTPHLLLVPWSWKSRAIPLLPLWAVWPVQSLSACTRVTFTLSLHLHSSYVSYLGHCISIKDMWFKVPRALLMKTTEFWDVMFCWWVICCYILEELAALQLQGSPRKLTWPISSKLLQTLIHRSRRTSHNINSELLIRTELNNDYIHYSISNQAVISSSITLQNSLFNCHAITKCCTGHSQ